MCLKITETGKDELPNKKEIRKCLNKCRFINQAKNKSISMSHNDANHVVPCNLFFLDCWVEHTMATSENIRNFLISTQKTEVREVPFISVWASDYLITSLPASRITKVSQRDFSDCSLVLLLFGTLTCQVLLCTARQPTCITVFNTQSLHKVVYYYSGVRSLWISQLLVSLFALSPHAACKFHRIIFSMCNK